MSLRTVFTIGEALIDFIPEQTGRPLKEVTGFKKAAGGAPANAACAVSLLGGRSAFIGKLGMDAFGDFLLETLGQAGVDTSRVLRTSEANTALAFVSLSADGSRDFSFYRSPSADMLLTEEEIDPLWFHEGDVLHFCSVDLIEAPVKYAHSKAIQSAKVSGAFISFDPNVRLPLWESGELCRQTILEFIPQCHLLKVSSDELAFITGIEEEQEAVKSLFVGEVVHVVYTKGAEGAVWYMRGGEHASVEGCKVKTVDTTGAGDAFIGALLMQLAESGCGFREITLEHAKKMLVFANAAAALSTAKLGAIDSLPRRNEVENFLSVGDNCHLL